MDYLIVLVVIVVVLVDLVVKTVIIDFFSEDYNYWLECTLFLLNFDDQEIVCLYLVLMAMSAFILFLMAN